ncbi:MAG: hypothetical protein M0Z52_13835 [Actinomycetota bacterium]|nr:hypothetical protein [Nitrospiraceae bacterium]MDA8157511.1 hypothetical protein [Actinomycetota bacterium]
MIRLQIIEKEGAKLHKKLKDAMNTGELKTFVVQNRGKKVVHTNKNYPGWMNWSSYSGVITCEILSPRKPGEEWKLLGAFIGRLSDKYRAEVHSINIQFE